MNEHELIKAKEKAEESNLLKSAFLMNMSHEIRTPMNGILGFMNLLKEPGLGEEDRIEFVSLINKSGDRLMNTINDLIEISKIEIGDISVKFENTDLTDIMHFYFNFFKREIEEKGLKLEIARQITGSQAQVMTDRHKLDCILMNLIKNAVKFTDKGKIRISNKIEDGKLWFSVSDTGRGIPKEKFESVFDRFVQVDMGGSRNYDGSGIGLSIVKAYIEALNGSIKIESELGKGSTFTFTIPYHPANVEFKESNDRVLAVDRAGNKVILVAEDDDINYYLIERLLGREFDILHAKTGEDAVKLFNDNPAISLILMDIKMPGEYDGLEAVRRIRKSHHDIPIIAQTAFTMDADKNKAIKAGCNEVITKPFNTNELYNLINKYQELQAG